MITIAKIQTETISITMSAQILQFKHDSWLRAKSLHSYCQEDTENNYKSKSKLFNFIETKKAFELVIVIVQLVLQAKIEMHALV